ncbi:very short patch repair endonuclease [Pararoseomonas indoligenes]|uniref:Very short patch repair endonuclease n=1 Tax=Roseomonas indoligenes TaxID=2820811 RepID=A0A940N0J4_9PROT|nr:very short patch repair endonuclease [Pararoseomonas indoligenes]MBP0495038.1 very short patch repair endonuclease [Pararoseomonas indoligenes]
MPPRMARIPVRDTKPERLLRAVLGRIGVADLEYNAAHLPGQPDVVLLASRVAAFAHGCFWHHHQGCQHGRVPATEYPWASKFKCTRARDAATRSALVAAGWRVLTVWECALCGPDALPAGDLDGAVAGFLGGTTATLELEGHGVSPLVRQPRAA